MEHLSRVPKNRIAVLIGKAGRTREMIEKACGGSLTIDSQSGDVSISWEGEPDPIKRMKVPDVISAIGRGFSPERAVQLLETNGRIRTLIEEHTGCEISIYGSTVAVIGDDDSLALAAPAIEGILGGSEHGTVLFGLEQDRKRQRLRSKNLDTFSDKSELEEGESVSFGEE